MALETQTFSKQYDFAADTPTPVVYGLNALARVVTFQDSNGNNIQMAWSIDPADEYNQILVTSPADLTAITVNIIAY